MMNLIIISIATIITFLIFCYLISKLTLGRCNCKVCLIGKTAIVTGGNSGIGYEVALALASRGCKVIIADKDTSFDPKNKIIKETNNPNVTIKYINLLSFTSIRQFAEDINKNENRLDILVNNAGVGAAGEELTEDGLNAAMQINYFGPFLLTHLLIDLLKKTAPSRIIFTSSILAFTNNMNIENLNEIFKNPIQTEIYSNSKVCAIISANGFAEKLKRFGVTSNSLHPGLVVTKIFEKAYSTRGSNRKLIIIAQILNAFYGKTANEGAQTTIHLALSNGLKETSGRFFSDCKEFYWTPAIVNNPLCCNKIWKESEKCVKLSMNEKL